MLLINVDNCIILLDCVWLLNQFNKVHKSTKNSQAFHLLYAWEYTALQVYITRGYEVKLSEESVQSTYMFW